MGPDYSRYFFLLYFFQSVYTVGIFTSFLYQFSLLHDCSTNISVTCFHFNPSLSVKMTPLVHFYLSYCTVPPTVKSPRPFLYFQSSLFCSCFSCFYPLRVYFFVCDHQGVLWTLTLAYFSLELFIITVLRFLVAKAELWSFMCILCLNSLPPLTVIITL